MIDEVFAGVDLIHVDDMWFELVGSMGTVFDHVQVVCLPLELFRCITRDVGRL